MRPTPTILASLFGAAAHHAIFGLVPVPRVPSGGGNWHHSVLRQGEREIARRRRQIERGLIHPIFPANL